MNYYNDNDVRVCAWLRELIKAGELPAGDVDERSITDVRAEELGKYEQCHFFAGIGGWPLALRWAGLEGVPGIWTGSCPCQPLSCAGKRQGHADERHLWPAFHGLIAECGPATVFGEQVASADGREWFAGVRLDLEDLGYAVGGADLCAAGVGAPHRRQRLFWVADMQCAGLEGFGGHGTGGGESGRDEAKQIGSVATGGATGGVADANMPGCDQRTRSGEQPIRDEDVCVGKLENTTGQRLCVTSEQKGRHNPGRGSEPCDWARFDILPCRDGKARRVEAGTFPLADGVSGRMGLLRGYGNAIVPQVAAEFVMAWRECVSGA